MCIIQSTTYINNVQISLGLMDLKDPFGLNLGLNLRLGSLSNGMNKKEAI